MTNSEIQELKADFIEWSGGFGPEECEADEIRAYLEANEIGKDDPRYREIWDLAERPIVIGDKDYEWMHDMEEDDLPPGVGIDCTADELQPWDDLDTNGRQVF